MAPKAPKAPGSRHEAPPAERIWAEPAARQERGSWRAMHGRRAVVGALLGALAVWGQVASALSGKQTSARQSLLLGARSLARRAARASAGAATASDSPKMVPLETPTADYASTPDDLIYCKDHDYCSYHGRCNVNTGACVCDDPWLGSKCSAGKVDTKRGRVLFAPLNVEEKDDRAEGNQLFLAKVHHRLRQVVAELSLQLENPDPTLVDEKFRLMHTLGLMYTAPGMAAHDVTMGEDYADIAARHPSKRGLPAVVTMRWQDPQPSDEQIEAAVSDALRQALADAVARSANSKVESGAEREKVSKPVHFNVFANGGLDAAEAVKLHRDDSGVMRNLHHEDKHDFDPAKPTAINVNLEHTDTLPGLRLLYREKKLQSATRAVPFDEDPVEYSKEVEKALAEEKQHERQEALTTKKVNAEAIAEEAAEAETLDEIAHMRETPALQVKKIDLDGDGNPEWVRDES